MEYNLDCRYDARQSFYGKAKVIETKEVQDLTEYTTLELYSYGTLVARITKDEETCLSTCELIPYKTLNGRIKTQTTTRHQKEFFRQYGLTDNDIKKLFKEGTLEV